MCNIRFTVDKPAHETIKVVNVIGVEVCTLLDDNEPPGQHEIDCDHTRFGPGSYYYKIYVDEPSYGKILKETKPLSISQNGESI